MNSTFKKYGKLIRERKLSHMARILIADSSELQRDLIDRMMTEEGHDTLIAKSGWQCVDFVYEKEGELDCVILDSFISNHRGFDVLESIKVLSKGLPVVILAGGEPCGLEASYRKFGAQGIVTRPTDRDVLLAEVKRVLSNRQRLNSRKKCRSLPACDM